MMSFSIVQVVVASSLLLIVGSFSSQLAFTYAFPGGVGACPKGEAAVGHPHTQSSLNTIQTGELYDGNFFLDIASTTIDDSSTITRSSSSVSVPMGTPLEWKLWTKPSALSKGYFRGFLLRLDGGTADIDTTDVFYSNNNDDNVQVRSC